MQDRDHRLRPDEESFEYDGYRVTLIDGASLLAAADGRHIEVLRTAVFGPPIDSAWLGITVEGRELVVDGGVRIGRGNERRATVSAVGRDPLSALLSWRADAGDPWAVRIVDGMGAVADKVNQRLRPPAEAQPDEVIRTVERADASTGLRIAVTYRGSSDASADAPRTVTLRASVTSEEPSIDHVRAACRCLIDVVSEFSRPPAGAALTVAAPVDAGAVVSLDQVGGLAEVVGRLRQIAISFRHPDAMARWGARRPQGLLLYGPPGTGKTMLARALAHEIGARFQEIHTPDILDKWLGASERNIKRIFRDARRYSQPTVMLFDEFDSIISYAGEGGDSASQAINAVAGIFKQEMNDLIEANPRIIVVATTNFPDRVDASLIRSGRFDIKVLVPAPDKDARADILAKMIRHLIRLFEVGDFRMFDDDLDLDDVATQSTGMTGADLAELLRRAQLAKAMKEARTGSPSTAITQRDLLGHLAELRSESLSRPQSR